MVRHASTSGLEVLQPKGVLYARIPLQSAPDQGLKRCSAARAEAGQTTPNGGLVDYQGAGEKDLEKRDWKMPGGAGFHRIRW